MRVECVRARSCAQFHENFSVREFSRAFFLKCIRSMYLHSPVRTIKLRAFAVCNFREKSSGEKNSPYRLCLIHIFFINVSHSHRIATDASPSRGNFL